MKKRTVALSLSFLLLAGLIGCNASGSSTSSEGGGDTITVGFAQIGAESAWRTANTDSIKAEAEKRGIILKFSDAQGKPENQIKAIRAFIAQGVDVIAFAPGVETGWEQVLREAKDAGIPVIASDRNLDVPDELYVTFIGSDFVEEGRRAAQWLAEKTEGKAVIAELTGNPGSSPANDRKKGFEEVIANYPNMQIVFSQTGMFGRAQGKQVMEALLKSPQGKEINVLYAHNDDMAIGAIQAIEEAGLKPGEDILIVSIDGIRDALTAITAGKLNCSIECNPLLGPILFDTIADILAGNDVPRRIVVEDLMFDGTNAAAALPNRKY